MINYKKFNTVLTLLAAFPLAFIAPTSATAASKEDVIAESERKEGADSVALKKGIKAIKAEPVKIKKLNSGRIKGFDLKASLVERKNRIRAVRRGYVKE